MEVLQRQLDALSDELNRVEGEMGDMDMDPSSLTT